MPKPKSKESLKEIYTLIVESLKATTPNITKDIKHYRSIDYHNWKDSDFLETMALVMFSSTLDWDVVKSKWKAVKRAFSDFDVDKVAGYSEKELKRLLKTPNIIPNKAKIRGIIQNAKQMTEIVQEYGSFANYVCFYPYDLKQDLINKFKFIGEKTVLDFMKEMGFPVIKDDKHIRRVFYRLGLNDSEDVEQEEILKIAKEIAEAVGENMPVVDCVFWSFGHYICKAKPDCQECSLTEFCNFQHKIT